MCFGTRFRLETYSFYVRIYSLIFSNSINFMKQRYLNTYSKIHFRSKKKFFPYSNSYRRRTVLFQLKNDDHGWLSPLIIVFSLLLPLGLYLLSPHFFFFFFLPVLSFRNHQRSFLPPPIVVGTPADDRLTFGLMALAGSRRWWMTVGERETFGAIRRFKRFFVTGARYVAAPAWPATMRQKQCWLIAFQNCERWKTVPGHPMVAATFLRTAPDVPRFLSRVRAGWGVFEERRFDSRKSQLNQVACDRCSRSKKRSLSRSSDDESRWFVHFSRGIHFVSKNGGSPLSNSWSIFRSFFFLFFFFHAVSGTRKCELLFLLLFIWTEESVRGIIPSRAQKTNLIIPVDPANSISDNLKW